MKKRVDRINNFRFPISQPTVFDEEELTVLRLVSKVAYKINETVGKVNNWIDYLDVFVDAFDENLQDTVIKTLTDWQDSGLLDDIINDALKSTVTETLTEWQDSGLLDVIINDALQTQMDVLEDETHTKLGLFETQMGDYANYLANELQENHIIRTLPNGIKDEIRVSGGKGELVKNVSDVVVLNGSEMWWTIHTITRDLFVLYPAIPGAKVTNDNIICCDKLTPQFFNPLTTNDNVIMTGGSANVERIFIKKSEFIDDLYGFKQWLAENNPRLTYQLAEPIIIPLPENMTPNTVEIARISEQVDKLTNAVVRLGGTIL